MDITGTIRIGEAQATTAATAKRQRGGAWAYFAVMFALWIGGGLIGFAIGVWLKVAPVLIGCCGALIGLFSYRSVANRLLLWRFRRRLTHAGTPLDMPARLSLTPEALILEEADVAKRAKWAAVSELFYAKGYWIFMVQSEPWFAPDHFFADAAAQRAFVTEALSHMSPAARERSGAAAAFAQGQA